MKLPAFSGLALLCSILIAASHALPPGEPKPFEWSTTGSDCAHYVGADVNADGFDDLLCLGPDGKLWLALNVHCWKSGGWQVVVDKFPAKPMRIVRPKAGDAKHTITVVCEGQFVELQDYKDGKFAVITPKPGEGPADPPSSLTPTTPPVYDTDAKVFETTSADLNADGIPDTITIFDATKPYAHHAVAVVLTPNPKSGDQDSDGLTDDQELALGTDLFNRDTDGDGLLDAWEVNALPRGIDVGPLIKFYKKDASDADKNIQLNPLRQDVICALSYFEGVDPKQFQGEMTKVNAVYNKLSNKNPDGSTGVWVHFIEIPGFITKADQAMPWWDVGNKYFPKPWKGVTHWMQITPWGGGQSSETNDMGGSGNGWQVFAHEFGHQLSLSHSGDSAPAWCPLYPSMMSYAFSYSFDGDGNKVHFSTGEFRDTILDEHKLTEKLPYPYEKLKYLANHPFRFTLKDNGDGTTLIDWNQNGKFDDGPVEADINYGGSTYAGTRTTHERIGSAPQLAYVGGTCYVAALTQPQDLVYIKAYKGGEKWGDARNLPSTASRYDPLLVGGPAEGLVFSHRFNDWIYTRFTDSAIDPVKLVPGVTAADMSACRVEAAGVSRILLVSRHDDNSLDARWFVPGDKPTTSDPIVLKTKSQTPVGLVVHPSDGTITMVTSMPNSKGGQFCMRVNSLTPKKLDTGETLEESDILWTRGETSGNNCTTRPVAVYHQVGGEPQLVLFHTGWIDANALWTAWRTTRIGNTKLDEGWLTSQLYDEWTRSRVGVAFADGPQGAIYAYRWDAGEYGEVHINTMQIAHNGYGIDAETMRDHNDAERISTWGIRHSIFTMNP
ncbi:MAG: hypothetical protein AABZ53_14820 [Planctomycetota bacterium]